jgi:hypothetical protein
MTVTSWGIWVINRMFMTYVGNVRIFSLNWWVLHLDEKPHKYKICGDDFHAKLELAVCAVLHCDARLFVHPVLSSLVRISA